jgi:hypothetical protein
MEHWISAHWLLSPIHPSAGLGRRDPRNRHSPPSGEEPQKHQVDERTQPVVADVALGLSGDREA